MQQGQAERVDFTPLPRYDAGLAVLHVTPQPADGAHAEVEAEPPPGSERRRHGLRAQRGRVERSEAVGRRCRRGNVLQCSMVRVSVGVQSDPERRRSDQNSRNGWSARLPNIAERRTCSA